MLAAVLAANTEPDRFAAMAPVIMSTPARPELGEELKNSFCRTDPGTARVFARATFLSDNRTGLPKITVPTLMGNAARTPSLPRPVGQITHQQLAGSVLVTLDATGHSPHLSAPVTPRR
ncbi:alpha/beta hydrolase [Amycolatopsis sp. NPDC051372]|uniref:alpha/beta fold hydrolase n=1 Tax=Amycolatopsis sp. NPDC051372 TaxID=3155669 RepID=UPI003417F68F